jgi:predicted acylesterase/phospholipase RssA
VSFQHFLNIFDTHFVDISFLARMWRGEDGHEKRLDVLALRESPTHAYVSVTPVTSRVSELVALGELRDPVEAIVAACAMPGLYFGDPRLDGTEYADGAITDPFPIRQLVNMEDPTSILVFMNRTKDEDDGGVGLWLYDRYVYYVLGRRSHIFVHEKNRRRAEAVAWLRSSGIPFCMVYTDDLVQPFTRDSALLSAAAARFEAYVTNLIEQARVEKVG